MFISYLNMSNIFYLLDIFNILDTSIIFNIFDISHINIDDIFYVIIILSIYHEYFNPFLNPSLYIPLNFELILQFQNSFGFSLYKSSVFCDFS